MRRALALCLAALMAAPALAATGPLDDAAPAPPRGGINFDRSPPPAPAAAPVQPARPGNPLWAIPLGVLSNTRERPLFTPSRRPPAPPVVAQPRPAPQPIARPVVPERLTLVLIGTVVGENDSVGVFLDQASSKVVRLRTGEGHAGWILRSVQARQATLVKDERTEVLSLPTAGGAAH